MFTEAIAHSFNADNLDVDTEERFATQRSGFDRRQDAKVQVASLAAATEDEDEEDERRTSEAPRQPKRSGCGCDECVTGTANCITRTVHKVMPPGGIVSTGFILASGSIGAGILGLPNAANRCGLAMAMIYLVIIACLTIFSMRMLATAAHLTNIKSFDNLTRALFPRWHHAFSYFSAFVRWLFCFGCCVGYVISAQDCFNPIFTEASRRNPDNSALNYFKSANGLRLVGFLVWLVIMLPLVVPKHVNSLRYASLLAIAFMCYFCITIIVHSCLHGLPEHKGNVVFSGPGRDMDNDDVFLFRTGNLALGELGTFMFSYLIHSNALETYFDMRPEVRSVNNFTKAVALGIGISTVIYALVTIFGYFDFGSAALNGNSLLLMYNPLAEPEMMVAYIGVLFKICVAYALLFIGARNSSHYFIGWTDKYNKPCNTVDAQVRDVVEVEEDVELALTKPTTEITGSPDAEGSIQNVDPFFLPRRRNADDDREDVDDLNVYIDNIPMKYHLLVVAIIAALSLICGLFIPRINIVFGFTGSICGGFLGFIFPALIVMYCGDFTPQKVGWFMYVITYVILIAGVIGIVFGTGSTIYSLVL